MAREAESSLSNQQRSNFKMVLVNNKPMHSWYNWLTAAGISEDQVEVRAVLSCCAVLCYAELSADAIPATPASSW